MSELNSKNLILKVLKLEYVDALTALFTKIEAQPKDRDAVVKTVFSSDMHWRKNGYGTWAILHKDTLEVIGITSLTNIAGKPYFHIILSPDAQGKGYAREGGEKVIEYAFKMHKLPQIFAVPSPADGFLEKLGFTLQEGVFTRKPTV